MSISPLYGIPFEELEGSPRISINQQGVSATRWFRVAWSDWQAFATELVGLWRIIGNVPLFVSPISFPGLPNLMVWDLAIEPLDPHAPDNKSNVSLGSATNDYSSGGAKITALYRTLLDPANKARKDLPQVPQGTYLTYSANLGTETLSLPGRSFVWNIAGNPSLPDDIQPDLLIPTGDFTLSWHRVLLPPWSVIRNLRGAVNQTSFLGSDPQTVMFLGARARREFSLTTDSGFWKVDYHFAENFKQLQSGARGGWNHFFKEQAVSGEHWIDIVDRNNHPPYRSVDFSSLFQFGS